MIKKLLISGYRLALQGWRLLTAPLRSKPGFLIIGAQKAGTTSLYAYLCQHPDILPASTKEVHFFDTQYQKGTLWYRSFFPFIWTSKKAMTGEASPYYLYHPHVPKRVADFLPDCKLIILLRNPIDRAYSQFQFTLGKDFNIHADGTTFEEALKQEKAEFEEEWDKMVANPKYQSPLVQYGSMIDRGKYLPQIQRWEKYFPREKMLILSSEAFFKDPAKITKQVWQFLGVTDAPLQNKKAKNTGLYSSKMSPETAKMLEQQFKQHNEALFHHLDQTFDW